MTAARSPLAIALLLAALATAGCAAPVEDGSSAEACEYLTKADAEAMLAAKIAGPLSSVAENASTCAYVANDFALGVAVYRGTGVLPPFIDVAFTIRVASAM